VIRAICEYELSPNYVPLSPLPLKVGGHVPPPAPMGPPPMLLPLQLRTAMLACQTKGCLILQLFCSIINWTLSRGYMWN